MPYKLVWVEPELALEHRGVKVYHTYADDNIDYERRAYAFTLNFAEKDTSSFSIRHANVPSRKDLLCTPPNHKPDDAPWVRTEKSRLWRVWNTQTEPQIVKQMLREAIDLDIWRGEGIFSQYCAYVGQTLDRRQP